MRIPNINTPSPEIPPIKTNNPDTKSLYHPANLSSQVRISNATNAIMRQAKNQKKDYANDISLFV